MQMHALISQFADHKYRSLFLPDDAWLQSYAHIYTCPFIHLFVCLFRYLLIYLLSSYMCIAALTGVLCRTRIELLPPDLIWPEWFSGHGPRTMANRRRPMAAYRYNLLEHIGTVSSFKVRVDRPAFPKCYESMADVWSLARAERFQVLLGVTVMLLHTEFS